MRATVLCQEGASCPPQGVGGGAPKEDLSAAAKSAVLTW